MRITIHGCRRPEVAKLLRQALQFYARQLFNKGGHRGITLKVILKDDPSTSYADEPEQGCVGVTHYDHNYVPTKFEMELLKTDLRLLFHNAAHEMVHVKQFRDRSMSSYMDTWKGKKLRKGTDYWDEPWEIEAYGREYGLFERYMEKYNLKQFFIENSRWVQTKIVQDY